MKTQSLTSAEIATLIDTLKSVVATLERVTQITHTVDEPGEQPPHALIGEMVSITKGQHAGKAGIVTDVRPSKFGDGLCATIDCRGVRLFANVAHCCPVSPQLAGKAPAPSVRRTVLRKVNGAVPW